MIFFYLWIFISLICESFPISSSGHALLFEKFWKNFSSILLVPDYFDHIMHGPIAFLIAIYFFERWSFLLNNMNRCRFILYRLIIYGFVIESITVLFYIFFKKYSISIPLYCGFFISACLLGSLLFCSKSKGRLTFFNSCLLGLAQGIALLPGISRFGSTFVISRWIGLSSRKSFELSFLIEWPISIAGFLQGIYHLKSYPDHWQLLNLHVALAILIAGYLAYLGLKYSETIIKNNALYLFSIYLFFMSIISFFIVR